MTKFQWEQQLSKYLSELPKEERNKVLEYYDELFCDKFETGESEERIILSFGEPSRVALEILRSYDSGQQFSQGNQQLRSQNNGFAAPKIAPPIFPTQQNPIKQNASDLEKQANGSFQGSVPIYNQSNYAANNQVANQALNQQPKVKKKQHPLMIVLYIFLFITVGIPLISGLFSIVIGILATIFGLAVCSVGGLLGAVAVLFMGMPLEQSLTAIGMCLFVSGIGFLCVPIGVRILKGIGKLFSKVKSKLFERRKQPRS